MRYPYVQALPVLIVLTLLPMAGCNGSDPGADQCRRLEENLAQARQELENTQRLRDQDRRVLEAQRKEAESDASAATMLWVSTAVALVIVILLLARERHLRRVLDRLAELVVDKKERGP